MPETWKPYQPANGSEGMWFMSNFCDLCKRDAAFRDGTGDSCPIAADTMVFKVTSPDYPKEWVVETRSRVAKCTAFEPEARPEQTADFMPGLNTKDSPS